MFTIEQLKQLSNFLINEFKEVFATKADIKVLDDKIVGVMKTVFSAKDEANAGFEVIDNKFSQLQTSVHGILNIAKDNPQEIMAVGSRVDNVEGWVKVAAPKIGLEYKT